MDKGLTPPNPSRLGAAPQMDKGLTPPTLRDLERLRKWTRVWPRQPFTTWRGSQMDKGWTPPTQPFTTWRVFLSRKLTASVTKFCLYNVPFTLRCRPISRFPYFASSREGVALSKCLSESQLSPAQPHRKPTVSSGTRQEPYRKPE